MKVTKKGKNFICWVFLLGLYSGILWEILFGWGNTFRLIAYLLGYQITPL